MSFASFSKMLPISVVIIESRPRSARVAFRSSLDLFLGFFDAHHTANVVQQRYLHVSTLQTLFEPHTGYRLCSIRSIWLVASNALRKRLVNSEINNKATDFDSHLEFRDYRPHPTSPIMPHRIGSWLRPSLCFPSHSFGD